MLRGSNFHFTGRLSMDRDALSAGLRLIPLGKCLLLGMTWTLAHAAPVPGQTHTVLVLYANDRLLPADVEADRGFRAAVGRESNGVVEVSDEFLDEPRFGGAAYEESVATFLRQKYASRPPEIVVAGGEEALDFVLRQRARLFPQVPLVHMGVTRAFLQALPGNPPDLIGVPIQYDFPGTVDQALRSHPRAKALVVIAGADTDRSTEDELHSEFARFHDRLRIEFLVGLSTEELTRRVRRLTPETIVFTPGYDLDGAGRRFTPRQSVELLAAASGAPVYGPYDTFIGTGIVGGHMPTFESAGMQAGEIVVALLGGVARESLVLPKLQKIDTHVDWRQVHHWNIDETTIDKGAVVHFREPTLWDSNRLEVIAGGTVMALLAALALTLSRTTAALRASEQRMILAQQAAKLAMWVWDVQRDQIRGVIASQPILAPPGARPVKFADVLAAVHPTDRDEVNRKLWDAVTANRGVDLQYRTLATDGRVHWLAVRGQPDPHSSKHWFGVVLDITDQKQAEVQADLDRTAMLHMSRVAMLGQMLASISHQLNQPLGAILANAQASQQLLGREPVDFAQVREIGDDIVTEVRRAADVISRLNALFKRRPMQLEQVDVNVLVAETIELARANLVALQIVVKTELAETALWVEGDRVQLQQVVLNLIINAADAMGSVPVVFRRLLVLTASLGATVGITVTDHGTGIAAEHLANVFEPFWSSKPSGMGIGLSICRSIIVAHHGTIVAANNPSGGASFSLTLPGRSGA